MLSITRVHFCGALLLLFLFSSTSLFAATITVDVNTDGTGAVDECELRDAILAANTNAAVNGCTAGNGSDLIIFSPALSNKKITLTADLPTITGGLEIAGPGKDLLRITGNHLYGMFIVTTGSFSFTIKGLTLFGGVAASGACISLTSTFSFTTLIEDVLLESCQSTSSGGAIKIYTNSGTSSATLRRVTLKENTSGTGGGAISLSSKTALIEDSTLESNSANAGGALSVGVSTQLSINRSTFWDNEAADRGSAILLFSTSIVTELASTTVVNNRVTDTIVDSEGAAIYTSGTVSLINTVVANNIEQNPFHDISDLTGGESSQIITLGHNFIGNNEGSAAVFPAGVQANGDQAGTAKSYRDARLDPLADNGGPTRTAMPKISGSPLVDQGSCSSEVRDQRGFGNPGSELRIIDILGEPNADDGCDIGAVEYLAKEFVPVVVFKDGFEADTL